MDDPSFSFAGPSRYGSSYITAADLTGTVSPASLSTQPSSSRTAQYPFLGQTTDSITPANETSNSAEGSLKRARAESTYDQASLASTPPAASSTKRPKGPKRDTGFVQPHQDLDGFLEDFWTRQINTVEEEDVSAGYALPLARIKKVMKSDEDVRMISAEVPVMFSKACEIFISELTCRAWLVAESQKRRTLQKSDVAAAIAHSDMFDFLIDIVPRDEGEEGGGGAAAGNGEQDQVEEGNEGDEGELEEEDG